MENSFFSFFFLLDKLSVQVTSGFQEAYPVFSFYLFQFLPFLEKNYSPKSC